MLFFFFRFVFLQQISNKCSCWCRFPRMKLSGSQCFQSRNKVGCEFVEITGLLRFKCQVCGKSFGKAKKKFLFKFPCLLGEWWHQAFYFPSLLTQLEHLHFIVVVVVVLFSETFYWEASNEFKFFNAKLRMPHLIYHFLWKFITIQVFQNCKPSFLFFETPCFTTVQVSLGF